MKGKECGPNTPGRRNPTEGSSAPSLTSTSPEFQALRIRSEANLGRPQSARKRSSAHVGGETCDADGSSFPSVLRTPSSGSRTSSGLFSSPVTTAALPDIHSDRNSATYDHVAKRFGPVGDLQELLRCLRIHCGQVRALKSSRGCMSEWPHQDIEDALFFIVNSVKWQLDVELDAILKHLEGCDGVHKELLLRRVCDALDESASTERLAPMQDDKAVMDDGSLHLVRIKTLNKLRVTYNNSATDPEAYRILRRLGALSATTNASLPVTEVQEQAEAVNSASRRILTVVRNLELPPRYARLQPDAGINCFPAIQQAMHSFLPQVAQILYTEHRSRLEDKDMLGRNVVHAAAQIPDLETLMFAIRKAPYLLESIDIYGMTAVCIAACNGHLDAVQVLVQAGASLSSRDSQGRTPLYLASGAGHLCIVDYMLNEGVVVDDDNLGRGSALHAAAAGGHDTICRRLLEMGAQIGWPSGYNSNRGFHTAKDDACFNGHASLADFLQAEDDRINLHIAPHAATDPSGPSVIVNTPTVAPTNNIVVSSTTFSPMSNICASSPHHFATAMETFRTNTSHGQP